MIAHTLNICAPYILCTFNKSFGIVELRYYYVYTTYHSTYIFSEMTLLQFPRGLTLVSHPHQQEEPIFTFLCVEILIELSVSQHWRP